VQSTFSNYQELLPVPLPGFESSGARDMSCGLNHTALVTTKGGLLTWGSGKHSKLGHGLGQGGNKPKDVKKPTPVDALEGVLIETVACG
ncbi:unnamed protein product, partial [Discosporangium mesarthrocarpum]